MKTRLLMILAGLFISIASLYSQTTVFTESFETDGEPARYSVNNGGVCNDFFERINFQPTCFGSNIIGIDSSWYFAGEDVDQVTGGGPGVLTFVNHNISGLTGLSVGIKFGTPRDGFEIDDAILIQASIDGGSYNNVGVFQGDPYSGTVSGPLRIDTDNNPTATPPIGTLVPNNGVLNTYTFSIPGAGTNLSIRIVVDVNGGTEEIAFDFIKVTGLVAVNNAPVLAGIEVSDINYTEGDAATQVTNTMTVTDSEGDNITSATVEISAGYESGEDVLSFTSQFGITGSQTGNALTLTGNTSAANFQTVLRSVKYQNSNTTNPSIATRTIRFRVSDGGSSNFQSRDINVSDVLNSAISLPACESFESDGHGTRYYAYEYISGNDFWQRHNASGGKHPSHGVSITGQDGNWIWVGEDVDFASSNPHPLNIGEMLLQPFNAGAGTNFTVEIDLAVSDLAPPSWDINDYFRVQYRMDGGAWNTIGAFYGLAGTNELRRDANLDGAADPAGTLLTSAMQRFTFSFNTSGTTLEVRAIHSSNGSEEIGFDRICVDGNVAGNSPPVLANIEVPNINYIEGSGGKQVSNTITVSDSESDSIQSAIITVFQGFDASEDSLTFTPQFGVTGVFAANKLTLTGKATVAQYQTLLRSVNYHNLDIVDPSLATRTIQFVISDGSNSNFQTRDIDINASLRSAQALPYCESFETDGHGDRYMSYQFNDGNSNFWERHDASGGKHPSHGQTVTGATGNYIWVGEDVTENSNPNPLGLGEMLLNSFVATPWDSFALAVNLAVSDVAPKSWETSDSLVIQYKMDGGAWMTIGAFYGDGNSNLTEDADLNGVADPAGTSLSSALTTFTYAFSSSGTNLQVRLVHKSDGSEEVAFDNFCVTGYVSCVEPDVATISGGGHTCLPDTLSIATGNLNGAIQWYWYEGSCGGTPIDSGTSIIVSPTGPTTYYVRGEGGCATSGACASVLVTPDTVAPSITCPANIVVTNDSGQCGAVVNFTIGAADNCGIAPDSIPGFTTLGSFEGKIYYVSDIPFTPQNAYSDALANGGHVVTVNNAAENNFLAQEISSRSIFEAWIGFDDSDIEGTFVWRSGETSIYTNWDVGQPDNAGNEDYASLYFFGPWNDRTAATTMPYILERNIGIMQVEGIASGSFFPVGVTSNTFIVTDAQGNKDSCTFTVTVNDTSAPVISCPTDIVVSNDAGQCGAVVSYNVTASDNCGVGGVETEYIVNGGFETGDFTGWTLNTSGSGATLINDGSYDPVLTPPVDSLPPISGLYDLITDQTNQTLHLMSQPFVVPNVVSNAVISWKDRIRSYIMFNDPLQEFKVEILDSTMTSVYEVFSTNPGDPVMQIGPNFRSFDITSSMQSLSGQMVCIRISVNVQLNVFNLSLDDISLKIGGIKQLEGIASGGFFPAGVTTNTFFVTDASGNTDTCSFIVTVNDTTAPTVFNDSICMGDSLYVGGDWQTTPGVYTDTAIASNGCDSLLVTNLYYIPDSVCNPDTTEKMLYIVSDSAWTLSTIVSTATSNSYPWPGVVGMVPPESTFTLPAEVGQPYPWNHLYTVMGSEVIKAFSGVRYYRYEFELTEHQSLNARFRMFVDDNMQIFINGHEIALEEDMGKANWRTANHDILFKDDGTVDNGYNGGDPFDTYTSANLDTIFNTGLNDIVLAIRNRTSKPDKGGFSFRMDLDKAGNAVIVKKDAAFEMDAHNMSFEMYPNPSTDFAIITAQDVAEDELFTIRITDLSGRVIAIYEVEGNELLDGFKINVDHYSTGVYLVSINGTYFIESQKLIKK